MNLPKEIEQFVNNLVPTDVGVDNVGDYVVRYEGFTDECNDGHDDNSIDDVYADAYQDFDNRQGQEAMVRGVAYDELGCDNNPVLYSVYKNINEAVNPDKMTGDEMRELLDKKHAWDDGIHNPEFINDVRRHNWVLIDNYPLAKLGSVEDPYDRIIDTDDDYAMRDSDLSEPIVIAPDRKSVMDGNHRVHKAREMGKTHLPAYFPMIKENKFNFKLIDNEITEGRLLRTTNNFKKLTGRDVADLLYLNSLVIYIMAKDSKQSDFALGYARKTTQYGNYTLFRTHATDMYLLSYIVNDPDSKQIKLKDSIFSKRFLKSCKFQPKEHSKFFYKLATQGKVPLATTYFMSLEKQIKINDSRYKSWRRMAVDWEHLKYRSRQYIVAKIIQEFRRIAVTSELVSNLQTMTKYRSYDITDKYSRKPSTGRKVAGAVAGAVAGGYAGKKIAKKLGKDSDKYKKAGTGIGAIAGYWAGGRQRQK